MNLKKKHVLPFLGFFGVFLEEVVGFCSDSSALVNVISFNWISASGL